MASRATAVSAGARQGGRATDLGAKLALLGMSLGLALVACEVAARALLPAPLPWLYPQVRYRADPTVVFALAPDQHAFTADKPVTINSRGLRGPLVPYERTAGRLRLLFLGDSITFGYGVTDDEKVTTRVQALLAERATPADVIDVSVPAYNTEQEVASLEHEGIRYRPDWVIVGVCWNDIGDKSRVLVSPDGWLVDAADGRADAPVPASESPRGYAIRNTLKRSRLTYGALEAWRGFRGSLSPDSHTLFRADVLEGRDTPQVADGWRRVADALHRLGKLGETHGFRTLLVAFPIPIALEGDHPHSSYPAHLREISDREGLPFLDLEPAFRARFRGHESLFIAYDGDHPNAVGHDIAAREVVQFLASQPAAVPAPSPGA